MTSATTSYRLGLALAVLTVLFLVYGAGALGIIGDGGRADLLYAASLVVLVVGAVLARFRAGGMALALAASAATTVLVGFVAIAAGLHQGEGASALEILGLSGMYAGLFGGSAWLFHRADGQDAAAVSVARS